MEDDTKFQEAIARLANNSQKWLDIKKFLEEEIRANQEIILLIDEKVKKNETSISKLN